ncbi:regulator of RNase E activity RraA [Geomicrobium halophilum]|uniref:Regulator of RNase E activity RraA n=1 Tax=Geomicrobium halophilum TaxID=549000 RepID=A0A841PQQ4_9BACL|nr:hypothetical protein [Geomicrobium halophilum]MBB6451079.1 regulator of RNase E activity RraA [Geomicrobium halophilum]
MNIALQEANDISGNKNHACWGFRVHQAEEAGLAGVMVTGAVTDMDELKKSNVPVFYESVSPITASPLGLEAEIHGPVSAGGVIFDC